MNYVIALLAGLLILLGALKLFAGANAKAATMPPPRTGGMVYETSASKIHEYVTGAEDWWQHLWPAPLFWIACFGTSIIVCLDYYFGFQKAGWGGFLVIGSLMAIADVAIPFIAMDGDVKGQRSAANWSLMVLFTAFTVLVVIGSTSEISTVSGARSDVAKMSYDDSVKLLRQKQAERDAIKIDRGAAALAELGKSASEAAARENERSKSGKPVCGPICEKLKAEAADYKARSEDQERKEKLTGEIETLKISLNGGGSAGGGGEAKMDADAMASNIEGMTAGFIPRDVTRRYGLTTLGIVLVVCLTVLWTMVGAGLASSIEWEMAHRGEIADTTRANLGLSPRYTAPPAPSGLLAGPAGTTSAAADGIIINVAAADMRKRYANDEQLLETDGLFETLLVKGEGGSVTIAALYRAYQVARLTGDPDSRYMTAPTMVKKLMVIAQDRDDVRVTADGVIEGWTLKPVNERKLEVSANAI